MIHDELGGIARRRVACEQCKDRTRLERVYDCHDRREQHLGFHAGNDYVDHLLEPVLDTVDGSRLIQGFIRIQNTGNQG